jgi:hypothetical protein
MPLCGFAAILYRGHFSQVLGFGAIVFHLLKLFCANSDLEGVSRSQSLPWLDSTATRMDACLVVGTRRVPTPSFASDFCFSLKSELPLDYTANFENRRNMALLLGVWDACRLHLSTQDQAPQKCESNHIHTCKPKVVCQWARRHHP